MPEGHLERISFEITAKIETKPLTMDEPLFTFHGLLQFGDSDAALGDLTELEQNKGQQCALRVSPAMFRKHGVGEFLNWRKMTQ